LSDCVSHALNVTSGHVSSPEMPNQGLDMASNSPLINFKGRDPLRTPESRHHEASPRGLQIGVTHFENGDGVSVVSFFALRVSPFRGRTDYVLSTLASLVHRIGTVDANFDTPRCPADSDLTDEHALSGGVDPNPKSGGAAAPQKVIGLDGLGGIDEAFSQGRHKNPSANYRKHTGSSGWRLPAKQGNPQLSKITDKIVFSII
jgi:hypothetical protein